MARDYHMEVNFQEAVREYYRAYAKKEVSESLALHLQVQRTGMHGQERVLTATHSDFE